MLIDGEFPVLNLKGKMTLEKLRENLTERILCGSPKHLKNRRTNTKTGAYPPKCHRGVLFAYHTELQGAVRKGHAAFVASTAGGELSLKKQGLSQT